MEKTLFFSFMVILFRNAIQCGSKSFTKMIISLFHVGYLRLKSFFVGFCLPPFPGILGPNVKENLSSELGYKREKMQIGFWHQLPQKFRPGSALHFVQNIWKWT